MKRSPLTADQTAARDSRREKFRQLAKLVSKLTPEQRAEFSRRIQPVSVEGHQYSATNSILLIIQNPTGSIFGGFRQWLKAGRCVRKGEHGSQIWVKVGGAANVEAPNEPAEGSGEERSERFFICGTVFDVSQTESVIPRDENPGAPVVDVEARESAEVPVLEGWINSAPQPAEVLELTA